VKSPLVYVESSCARLGNIRDVAGPSHITHSFGLFGATSRQEVCAPKNVAPCWENVLRTDGMVWALFQPPRRIRTVAVHKSNGENVLRIPIPLQSRRACMHAAR
jgi:hypothetical protein